MLKITILTLLSLSLSFLILTTFLFIYCLGPAKSEDEFPSKRILHFSQFSHLDSPKNQRFTVATYNIGYGSGNKNNEGSTLNITDIRTNLESIKNAIQEINPDILLLQEVDFDSKRSHHINQLLYLAEELRYPFAAYVVTWNKRYLPWPYWPIQHQFGQVLSGQAVLSRFPILQQEVLVFEKPSSNSFYYNWFYLDRLGQKLQIKTGEQTISLFHVHLEAFSENTRKKQIKKLASWIEKERAPSKIVGGDFNQPYSDEKLPEKDLENSKKTLQNFANQTDLNMDSLYQGNLTFPSWDPKSSIDHLFFSNTFNLTQEGILSKTYGSDHLPIWIQLEHGHRTIQ